jgi:hypothetical protein
VSVDSDTLELPAVPEPRDQHAYPTCAVWQPDVFDETTGQWIPQDCNCARTGE